MDGLSLHEQLNAVRMKQGRDPLPDPMHIQGFGAPEDPPTPSGPIPQIKTAFEIFGHAAPDDDEAPEVEPQREAPKFVAKDPELGVADEIAFYRGRDVKLVDREKSAIAAIVLKAIRRSLDEQYQELTGTKPRLRKESKKSGKK